MAFKSDIEIAQETKMDHIRDVAAAVGIDEKYVEQYGKSARRRSTTTSSPSAPENRTAS